MKLVLFSLLSVFFLFVGGCSEDDDPLPTPTPTTNPFEGNYSFVFISQTIVVGTGTGSIDDSGNISGTVDFTQSSGTLSGTVSQSGSVQGKTYFNTIEIGSFQGTFTGTTASGTFQWNQPLPISGSWTAEEN